jgi:hypothetical protein
MTPRVAALVFAVLLAAPSVAAAPAPGRSPTTPAAATAGSPLAAGASSRRVTIRSRGKVNVSKLDGAGHLKPANRSLPMLGHPKLASGAGPRVAGPLVVSPPGLAATTTRPPIAQPGFAGLSATPGGLEPPDPWVAAGPDHVVQTVNVTMRITNRQGVASRSDIDLTDLFSLPASFSKSDPRVIYDSLHGRWIATELSWNCASDPEVLFGRGELDIAISDAADPTGFWTSYYIPYLDELPDYPGVGTSTDKIAISANVFAITESTCTPGAPDFVRSDVNFMDWAELAAAVEKPHAQAFAFGGAFSVRPALQVPATTATIFAVGDVAAVGPEDHVGYFTFTGSVPIKIPNPGSMAVSYSQDITGLDIISKFGDPHAPVQNGGTVTSAIDGRPTDATWQGGRLIFTSTTNCTPPTDIERDCVRVAELTTGAPNASPVLRQDFLLGALGFDYYFGGIGLSLNGSLHVTYARSSATTHPDGQAVYQLSPPLDATNAVSPAQTVLAGTASYTGSRWGDYMGVATDPQVPGTVWRVNMASAVASPPNWQTSIGQLSTDAGSTYVPITPVRVLDTRVGTGLSGRFQSNIARSFQITGAITDIGPIPPDAVAITGNVTEVQQTAVGYVAVTPRPTNKPKSATVNFPVGDARNNNVTTAIGPNGMISATYVAGSGKTTHLVFDVTGFFVADSSGATFNTVKPYRILDTRDGTGGISTKFRQGVPQSFQVRGTGGLAGVPDDPLIVAVTGNLTVTGQNSAGDVALGPVADSTPATSNLNYIFGDNRGNGVSVKLSADGKLWADLHSSTATARADLVFDVTGYYKQDGTGLKFYPLNPGRIMDTRAGVVLSGLTGPFVGSTGTTNTRTLDTDGHWGIPADAKAITGNLAITAPAKAGHITIMLATTDPQTASLNFPAGDTRSNGITVPVTNPGGDLLMHYHTSTNGGTVHLILDATGYFK